MQNPRIVSPREFPLISVIFFCVVAVKHLPKIGYRYILILENSENMLHTALLRKVPEDGVLKINRNWAKKKKK